MAEILVEEGDELLSVLAFDRDLLGLVVLRHAAPELTETRLHRREAVVPVDQPDRAHVELRVRQVADERRRMVLVELAGKAHRRFLALEIARDHPDVYIHSHLAENHGEIAWVRQLFPWSAGYLDVYERYGLLRERATSAHGLHLSADERRRLGASGACAACSPTSNLYLGSGLFDFDASDAAGLRYALATDVGGGTSFSQLRTMAEAYKVAQMQGQRLPALRAFYLATLGGARALHLQDRIGSFRVGNEADFIVLDWSTTPLMQRRIAATQRLDEKLLALMMLGDDRLVAQTYILGQAVLP